jgi:CRISPR-associated protein Cmr5
MASKKRKRGKSKKKFAQTKRVEPKTQNMDQARTVTSTMPQAGISGASRSMVKNQQQERAKQALQEIQAALETIKNDKKLDSGNLKSYANAFPAMIQMNGIGQAAAYYYMKGKEHRILYELLSQWLIAAGKPYANCKNLLEGITDCNMHTYRIAQAEALVFLDWVKKFANAYCAEDKKQEVKNEP